MLSMPEPSRSIDASVEAALDVLVELAGLDISEESAQAKELLNACPSFFGEEVEARIIAMLEAGFTMKFERSRIELYSGLVKLGAYLGVVRCGRTDGANSAIDQLLSHSQRFVRVYVPEYADRVLSVANTPPWEDWRGCSSAPK